MTMPTIDPYSALYSTSTTSSVQQTTDAASTRSTSSAGKSASSSSTSLSGAQGKTFKYNICVKSAPLTKRNLNDLADNAIPKVGEAFSMDFFGIFKDSDQDNYYGLEKKEYEAFKDAFEKHLKDGDTEMAKTTLANFLKAAYATKEAQVGHKLNDVRANLEESLTGAYANLYYDDSLSPQTGSGDNAGAQSSWQVGDATISGTMTDSGLVTKSDAPGGSVDVAHAESIGGAVSSAVKSALAVFDENMGDITTSADGAIEAVAERMTRYFTSAYHNSYRYDAEGLMEQGFETMVGALAGTNSVNSLARTQQNAYDAASKSLADEMENALNMVETLNEYLRASPDGKSDSGLTDQLDKLSGELKDLRNSRDSRFKKMTEGEAVLNINHIRGASLGTSSFDSMLDGVADAFKETLHEEIGDRKVVKVTKVEMTGVEYSKEWLEENGTEINPAGKVIGETLEDADALDDKEEDAANGPIQEPARED